MFSRLPPNGDGDLVTWSSHFAEELAALGASIGISAPQIAAYTAADALYASKYEAAVEPTTRGRISILEKNEAKASLLALAREIIRIIQANPAVTDAQRATLWIPVHKTEATPIPAPSEAPLMKVTKTLGRVMSVELRSLDSERRGKPAGVDGAIVMSFVGSAPPADLDGWVMMGNTSRTSFDIEFPTTVAAGAQVWLCAYWYNERKEAGPACTPFTVQIGGIVQAA